MGLSGSGKSSLLRAVNGLNPITRSLQVKMATAVELSSQMPIHFATFVLIECMVFQKFPVLMPWLTVLIMLLLGLKCLVCPKRKGEKSARAACYG